MKRKITEKYTVSEDKKLIGHIGAYAIVVNEKEELLIIGETEFNLSARGVNWVQIIPATKEFLESGDKKDNERTIADVFDIQDNQVYYIVSFAGITAYIFEDFNIALEMVQFITEFKAQGLIHKAEQNASTEQK